MGLVAVSKYELFIAGNGGKYRLITTDGKADQSPALIPLQFFSAIAAVLLGPQAMYDHSTKVFCSGTLPPQPGGVMPLAGDALSPNKSFLESKIEQLIPDENDQQ